MYLPAFIGVEVFGGSPDAKLPDNDPAKLAYNEGTRAYSLGMTGACCLARLPSRTPFATPLAPPHPTPPRPPLLAW